MKQPAKTEPGLVGRIRAYLNGPDITEQRMFGGTCFMFHGNMVAGTLRGELLVRVGKDGNDAALRRPHTHVMEMSRPAPGYIMVTDEGTRRDRDLKAWLDLAMAHVSTLPAKKKAAGQRKAAAPSLRKKATPSSRRTP